MFVLAVLFGAAYGVIVYRLGTLITYFGADAWVFESWVLFWFAVGGAGLTVWTCRFAGIDVRKTTRSGGAR